ncbi:MAG: hypothetical protein ACK4KV_16415 [Rhodocyclaceae bacterium]
MIFILSGLNPDTSEALIREGLAPYFTVQRVTLDLTSTPDDPFATVEVADSMAHVWEVTHRLEGIIHRGRRLRFYIPTHQPHPNWVARDEDDDPFGRR